jgi:hypothetical protein
MSNLGSWRADWHTSAPQANVALSNSQIRTGMHTTALIWRAMLCYRVLILRAGVWLHSGVLLNSGDSVCTPRDTALPKLSRSCAYISRHRLLPLIHLISTKPQHSQFQQLPFSRYQNSPLACATTNMSHIYNAAISRSGSSSTVTLLGTMPTTSVLALGATSESGTTMGIARIATAGP